MHRVNKTILPICMHVIKPILDFSLTMQLYQGNVGYLRSHT